MGDNLGSPLLPTAVSTATSISSYPAAQQTSSMTEHHRTAKTGPGIMMMVNQ